MQSKNEEKNLKSSQRERKKRQDYLKRQMTILIDKKTVEWHLYIAGGKKLTQNSISNKSILQTGKGNEDIFRSKKLEKISYW